MTRTAAGRVKDRCRRIVRRNAGRPWAVALLLVVVAGFGLRFYTSLTPVEKDKGKDSRVYALIAENLYEHGRFGDATIAHPSDWSPGAPLLYAAVYFATGGVHPGAARLAVDLLGTATIVLVFLIAKRLVRRPRRPWARPLAGLVGASLTAFYPTLVWMNHRFYTEPIAAFLLAAAVLAFLWCGDTPADRDARGRIFDRGKPWRFAVPGLLLGLLALVRPDYLPFGFLFGALAFFGASRSFSTNRRSIRAGLVATAVLMIAFVLPIVPWTVRNAVVLDRFVPISTGGGKVLYEGTFLPGDGNEHGWLMHWIPRYDSLRRADRQGEPVTPQEVKDTDADPILDRIAAERFPDLPRDQALSRLARENLDRYLVGDPFGYLSMTIAKIPEMWTHVAPPAVDRRWWAVAYHLVALAFGLLGLVLLTLRRRFEAAIMWTVLAGVTLLGVATLANPRRNVPAMPIVFSLAGYAVATVVSPRKGVRPPSRPKLP